MKRSLVVFILVATVLTLAGCGSKPDPFVGDWKSVDYLPQMFFHVDAPADNSYAITWTNDTNDKLGVMHFTAERKSDGVYAGTNGDDTLYQMVGDTVMKVKYIDQNGKPEEVNFTKGTQ